MTALEHSERLIPEPQTLKSRESRKHHSAWTLALIIAILAAVVASFCIGAYPISFWQAGGIFLHLAIPLPLPVHPYWTLRQYTIVEMLRIPRALVATFSGMALGMAGATLQGMMRNPLVGPDLVGVSSGAAFGGMLAMLLGLSSVAVIGLAFSGGLAAMACTFGLARLARGGTDGVALILSGIFIGAFFTACTGMVEFLADPDSLPGMVFWLLGTFTGASPQSVWLLAVPTLGGGAVLMLLRWQLNLLSLGDLDAATLGINVSFLRWTMIAIVSLMIAAQVSVCGVIGWIGLVIPHCARMLVGPDHRHLLPASALLGGLFTLGIDDFTRTILQQDVPVGALTALIGTPFICFLFWKTQAKGWIDG